MNVIVANERRELLGELNIEIIKSVNGVFLAEEIVEMFSNFFFGRMILDLTAVQNYQDVKTLQKISIALDVEKIIVLLPDNPVCLQPQYLSKLISMGIYNFTTNIDGVNYLLTNPNIYRDVAHLHQIDTAQQTTVTNNINQKSNDNNESVLMANPNGYILGVKNLSEHAGASTLSYMLKKALEAYGTNAIAIEVGKRDFTYFNTKGMISATKDTLASELLKNRNAGVIIIDMNDHDFEDLCTEVIYLLETSSIKLNRLMIRDRRVFEKIRGKKIVLSQSLLTEKDVIEFEYESKSKVFHNIPPLDERNDNKEILGELLIKLGLIQ